MQSIKRVSLKDIATETQLSKTTVSFILNGKGEENNISRETIEKVLEVAKRLNYRPNYLAKSLSSGKSNTIGLIVPRITDTYFAQIASVMEMVAETKGYTVVYGSTEEQPEKEQNLIDTFLDKQVDGLVIASSLKNEENIRALRDRRYPFVLIDRYYSSISTNYVVVTNEQSSYNMVKMLLTKGYRNVAMVTVSSYLNLMVDRYEGYKRALLEEGIAVNDRLIKEVDLYNMENSTRCVIDELLLAKPRIDAIYFTTHDLAFWGFKHLRTRCIAIPENIAICCFGDSPYFELFTPPITAIPMPAKQIGQEAARILFNLLEQPAVNSIEQYVLPVEVTERKSC